MIVINKTSGSYDSFLSVTLLELLVDLPDWLFSILSLIKNNYDEQIIMVF